LIDLRQKLVAHSRSGPMPKSHNTTQHNSE
jgi:hypothetical protein